MFRYPRSPDKTLRTLTNYFTKCRAALAKPVIYRHPSILLLSLRLFIAGSHGRYAMSNHANPRWVVRDKAMIYPLNHPLKSSNHYTSTACCNNITRNPWILFTHPQRFMRFHKTQTRKQEGNQNPDGWGRERATWPGACDCQCCVCVLFACEHVHVRVCVCVCMCVCLSVPASWIACACAGACVGVCPHASER